MKKYIIALGVLCLCLELVAQSYPKKKKCNPNFNLQHTLLQGSLRPWRDS